MLLCFSHLWFKYEGHLLQHCGRNKDQQMLFLQHQAISFCVFPLQYFICPEAAITICAETHTLWPRTLLTQLFMV